MSSLLALSLVRLSVLQSLIQNMSVAMLALLLGLRIISIIPSVTSDILQRRADPGAASIKATSTSSSVGLLLPNLPISNSNTSFSALNSLNLSTSQVGIPRPHCERELGVDLNPPSCVSAYYMMDSYLKDLPKQDVTVGERGQGIWDLPNPTRFLSSKLNLDTLTSFGVSSSNGVLSLWTKILQRIQIARSKSLSGSANPILYLKEP